MSIKIEEVIIENNHLVDEINKAYEDKNIHYLDTVENIKPKYKRYEELHAIIKLNNQMSKQKEKNEVRNFISVNKDEIINTLGNECQICGFDLKSLLIIHHKKPIADGGGNDLNNLSILCPNCHSLVHYFKSKQEKDIKINTWLDLNMPRKRIEKMFEIAYPDIYER